MRDRLALLCLLRSLGAPGVTALTFGMLLVQLLPAATAGAVGFLVQRAVTGGGLVLPLALVAGVLLLDLIAPELVQALRDWAALRVNGHVRHLVRRSMSGPGGRARATWC